VLLPTHALNKIAFYGSNPEAMSGGDRRVVKPANVEMICGIFVCRGFVFVIALPCLSNLISPHKRNKEKQSKHNESVRRLGLAWGTIPLGL